MNPLIQSLNWRYATKKFDATKKLTEEQVNYLIESVRLTPTSYGLQLFKLLNITDPSVRGQIQTAARGQSQIVDASQLFIFAAKTEFTPTDIDAHLALMKSSGALTPESESGLINMLQGLAARFTPEKFLVWNQKQTYIALGFLLAAAAVAQIDSCPMEGFDVAAVNQILKLDGYTATLICPVGFRSTDDKYAFRPKVRQSTDSLLQI